MKRPRLRSVHKRVQASLGDVVRLPKSVICSGIESGSKSTRRNKFSLPESHRASRLARVPQGRLRWIEITDYRPQFTLADVRRAWMGEKPAAVIPVIFYKLVGWGDSL